MDIEVFRDQDTGDLPLPLWQWVDEEGGGSETCFASREAALADAPDTLEIVTLLRFDGEYDPWGAEVWDEEPGVSRR